MVRITCLLLLTALPLFAGFVGPQYSLSTPVVDFVPAYTGYPRIASNGDGFLVAWSENLGGMRAVRLDADGAPIDDEPVFLASRGGVVDIASDGRDYVIAANCGTQEQPQTCFHHFDTDTGTAAAGATVDGEDASIASDGSGYLATYLRKDRLVDLVPLRADGTFAGPAFTATSFQNRARIASNGERYYLVYVNDKLANGVVVTETGEVEDRRRLSPAGTYFALDVASDGHDFLVTFSERTTPPELRATRVSRDGVPGLPTSLHREGIDHALAWTGSRYAVTYTTAATSDIRAVELSTSGDVVGSSKAVGATSDVERGSAVAGNGRTTIAVWYRELGAPNVLMARRLDSDAPPFLLVRGASSQAGVAATNRAVVWQEVSGAALTSRVFLQRLGSAGEPLDGRGIAMPASTRHQFQPAIGHGAVAWFEAASMKDAVADVMAMRLDASGLPTGTPRKLGTAWADGTLSVALDDFVVWQSPEAIVGIRVNDGAEPVLLAIPRDRWSFPRAVSSDAGFLLLWEAQRLQAFDRNGRAVGPHHDLYAAHQAVWNGTDYVVFGFASYGDGNNATRVRRFSVTGIQIGDDEDLDVIMSAVAWSGSEYRSADDHDRTRTLWITRLDAQFRIIESFPLPPTGSHPWNPILTRDLLIYEGLVPEDSAHRVVARRIGDGAAPPRRRTSG